ncbi:relaxase/mobilization nuclease domain-containing protein [Brucella thiophenivorans]|nr:relaxase/mobilization nuclease domain-containing protein [Brucella thiophenivorans]
MLEIKDKGRSQNVELNNSLKQAFGENVDYMLNDKADQHLKSGERVEATFYNEGALLSLQTAAKEMEAHARIGRCKDPVLHSVIAYASMNGEDPTPDQIRQDVENFLRERGLVNAPALRGKTTPEQRAAHAENELNQYVAVVHGDTKNKHVHILVNRVSRDGHIASLSHFSRKNDNLAARISRERNWDVVNSVYNQSQIKEQAIQRGASKDELAMLEAGQFSTFTAMRKNLEEKARLTTAELAARNADKASFVEDYSETVQNAFKDAKTMQDFKDKCFAAGVIVKFSEKTTKKGNVLPGVSYADIFDGAGKSGTQIGVPAKALIEKFGQPQKDWVEQAKPLVADVAARESLAQRREEDAKARRSVVPQVKPVAQVEPIKPIEPVAKIEPVISVVEKTENQKTFERLVDVDRIAVHVDRQTIAKEKATLQFKIVSAGSKIGLFQKSMQDRQARHLRLQRRADSNQRLVDEGNKILVAFEKERIKLQKQLDAIPDHQSDRREKTELRIFALDAKAEYEIFRKKFMLQKKQMRDKIYKDATHSLKSKKKLIAFRTSVDKFLFGARSAYRSKRQRENEARYSVNADRDARLKFLNNQNPATYLDWLKNQPNSARNMAAVEVEVSRLKWIKEQDTKRAAPAPRKAYTAPTPEQYKADLAKSKAQREEQARIKQAQIDAEHKARLAAQRQRAAEEQAAKKTIERPVAPLTVIKPQNPAPYRGR